MAESTPITAYERSTFTAPIRTGETVTHDVYQRGESRKVILLLQELPGINEPTLALADRLVERGFRVVMPHLLGPLGKSRVLGNTLRLCISKEFYLFASGQSSPIVDWLAALCHHLRTEQQVPGIAVIGMCLTGDFAISLMANDSVLAAYASQPSMPFFSRGSLPFSPAEVARIKDGLSAKGPMKCARFSSDITCQPGKVAAIDQTFNDEDQQRIEVDHLPSRGFWMHSILTLHYDHNPSHPTRKKLEEVVTYFDRALDKI